MPLPAFVVAGLIALFAAISSIQVFRRSFSIGTSDSQNDEDDDDHEEDAAISNSTEKVALIHDGNTTSASIFRAVASLLSFGVIPSTTATAHKHHVMERKSKGTKKIHKASFYPLLDETASWFAQWEAKKMQALSAVSPLSEPSELRIAKDMDLITLDHTVDSSVASFYPNTHVTIPVAVV